eukprot:m.29919 g.29919  ORF g.29919 m.29919 type:complete len:72 (+) comp40790_c0_seq2:76-291(+)
MSTSCEGLREQVRRCLSESECMNLHRKSAQDCIQPNAEGMTAQCKSIVQALFECKRSMLDMRQRFRGSKGF